MIDFKQVDEARKILELAEEASLLEIREAFRNLALKYHPDKCKDKHKKHCEKMFKKINQAKEIIDNYCANYRFSFKEKELISSSTKAEQEHYERFYDDWFGGVD